MRQRKRRSALGPRCAPRDERSPRAHLAHIFIARAPKPRAVANAQARARGLDVRPPVPFIHPAIRHPSGKDERGGGCPRAPGRRHRARTHPAVRHRLPHLPSPEPGPAEGRPAALRQRGRAPHLKLQAPVRRAAPVAQVRAAVLRRRRRQQAFRRHAAIVPGPQPRRRPSRLRPRRHRRRPGLGPTRGSGVLPRRRRSMRGPERGPGQHGPAQGGDAHGGLRVEGVAGDGERPRAGDRREGLAHGAQDIRGWRARREVRPDDVERERCARVWRRARRAHRRTLDGVRGTRADARDDRAGRG